MTGLSTKSQAPNTKQIPMTEIRNTPYLSPLLGGERDGVRGIIWKLVLGNYLGFGIWNLEFEKGHFNEKRFSFLPHAKLRVLQDVGINPVTA
jgi:hypothetical protein